MIASELPLYWTSLVELDSSVVYTAVGHCHHYAAPVRRTTWVLCCNPASPIVGLWAQEELSPSTPSAGMTKKETGTFINGRGQRLHTVQFEPAGSPVAFLIFHHGYGEHTGRYDHGKPNDIMYRTAFYISVD